MTNPSFASTFAANARTAREQAAGAAPHPPAEKHSALPNRRRPGDSANTGGMNRKPDAEAERLGRRRDKH